jgi:hypothetical protein
MTKMTVAFRSFANAPENDDTRFPMICAVVYVFVCGCVYGTVCGDLDWVRNW